MKSISRHLTALVFILCLVPFLFQAQAVTAQAKTITVQKQRYTTSKATANKKAKTVSTGTYKVKADGSGYLKFKAPKAGKYSFTFSNIKVQGMSTAVIYLMTASGSKIKARSLKTEGGTYTSLHLQDKKSEALYTDVSPLNERCLTKRTGTLSLKKGQTVFISLNYWGGLGYTTITMKIKKK